MPSASMVSAAIMHISASAATLSLSATSATPAENSATHAKTTTTIVEAAAGVSLVSVHHDISTITGEELFAFSLRQPPACRPKKQAVRADRGPLAES